MRAYYPQILERLQCGLTAISAWQLEGQVGWKTARAAHEALLCGSTVSRRGGGMAIDLTKKLVKIQDMWIHVTAQQLSDNRITIYSMLDNRRSRHEKERVDCNYPLTAQPGSRHLGFGWPRDNAAHLGGSF